MIKFKFRDSEIDRYPQWFSFYPKRDTGTGFHLVFNTSGYFDPRPQINTNITTIVSLILPFISLWLLPISLILSFYGWGIIYLKLPYDTKRDTSEYNTYGIMFYHPDGGFPNNFWIRGYKSFSFPWAYKFKKKEILTKLGWKVDNRYGEIKEDEISYKYYPYEYRLKSGVSQHTIAKVHQVKTYWVNWFGFGKKYQHSIEIDFKSEIGESVNSWKGGTIGCGWTLKPNETPYEGLIRMEKERKFN